jgi:hypothetical protein
MKLPPFRDGPTLRTLSGPNLVRIELGEFVDGFFEAHAWAEGPPGEAIANAWAILDSARIAIEKSGVPPPVGVALAIDTALQVLGEAMRNK